MRPIHLQSAAITIAAVAFSWWPAAAHADVLPPKPSTLWGQKEIPSTQSIALAGVCLSAAVIAVGLLASRLGPLQSAGGRAGLAIFSLMAVAAIGATAFGFYRQAEHDREQWQQYDHAVKNRRWTPPPRWDGPPPESVPPPASSQSP